MDTFKAAIKVNSNAAHDTWVLTGDDAKIMAAADGDVVYAATVEELLAHFAAQIPLPAGYPADSFAMARHSGYGTAVYVSKGLPFYTGPSSDYSALHNRRALVLDGAAWKFEDNGFSFRYIRDNDGFCRSDGVLIVTHSQKRAAKQKQHQKGYDIWKAANAVRPISLFLKEPTTTSYYETVCWLQTAVVLCNGLHGRNAHRRVQGFLDFAAAWRQNPEANRKYALSVAHGDELVIFCDWMDREAKACKRLKAHELPALPVMPFATLMAAGVPAVAK